MVADMVCMAAAVRVTCPSCGDQELTSEQLRARVCIDNDQSEYRFTCPECKRVTVLQTQRRIIDLLQSSGVQVDLWSLPAELFETHTGQQLTHNDIIDFHIVLEDDDAFSKALAELD